MATALDRQCVQTAEALASGAVNLAQAGVIAEAIDALPKDLGNDLLVKAEAVLVEKAAEFGPRELRIFGRGVLEHLAPEIADEVDYRRLLAEEARAHAATRLTMRPRGDGSTDVHARIPDHAAGRLRAYLNAFTAPRRRHLQDNVETPFGPLTPPAEDEFANLPLPRQRGEAFVALLENIPTKSLPRHGSPTTTPTARPASPDANRPRHSAQIDAARNERARLVAADVSPQAGAAGGGDRPELRRH